CVPAGEGDGCAVRRSVGQGLARRPGAGAAAVLGGRGQLAEHLDRAADAQHGAPDLVLLALEVGLETVPCFELPAQLGEAPIDQVAHDGLARGARGCGLIRHRHRLPALRACLVARRGLRARASVGGIVGRALRHAWVAAFPTAQLTCAKPAPGLVPHATPTAVACCSGVASADATAIATPSAAPEGTMMSPVRTGPRTLTGT